MSRHDGQNVEASKKENSLLSVFTKLGWESIWIGTQSLKKYFRGKPTSVYDEVNISIIPGGSALYKMNDYDEVMLPYIENFLKKPEKSIMVIHTSGSHWNYGARYPKSFKYFEPVCEELSGKKDHSSCGHTHLINSYDNSVRYTDYILSSIISMLEDKKAFLIYVSDHGESLGEDGFYGHGSLDLRKEQQEVPLIAWFSDAYLASKPHLNSLDINQTISQDIIFHSLLDCASISSNLIDEKLSICSKGYYGTK